jgi:hypothetical protein
MLVLVPTKHGVRKDWVYRSRANGRDQSRTLGQYPELKLSEARALARERGAQPEAMKRRGSLDDLLDAYVKSLRARGAERTAADVEGEFNRSIPKADAIRRREARSITTADVTAVLRRKAATGATTRVNRLRAMLSAAFNYAAKHDYDPRKPAGSASFLIQHNPASGTLRVAEWERVRDRVLTRAEAHAFWDRMRTLNGTAQRQSIGAFWCFVLLTGQRVTQLLDAKREGDVLVMTDTKGRGAKAKRHAIPLTPLLAALWEQTAAARAANTFTVRVAANEALPDGVTPLDIRRTVETVLKDAGVSREERAELLSHGRSGVQAAHYERTDYLPQKAQALTLMEAWLFPVAMTGGGQ